MEHTDERLIHATDTGQVGSIELADGTVIAQTQALVGDSKHISRQANARRIVDCVNACSGIPSDTLTQSEIGWVTDQLARHESANQLLRNQRDELFIALALCQTELRRLSFKDSAIDCALGRTAAAIEHAKSANA